MTRKTPEKLARIKRAPVFFASLLAFSAVSAAIAWSLQHDIRDAQRARRSVERHRRELRQLEMLSPRPTAETARVIGDDLDRATERVLALRAMVSGPGADIAPAAGDVAATRARDYFEIASFVARMRDVAAESRVGLRVAEHFGFEEYANAGPTDAAREQVLRDCLNAEQLLRKFYGCNPVQLESFDRETMTANASIAQAPADSTTGWAAQRDERGSAFEGRREGVVRDASATMFRLMFTAETATLRAFLNRLAEPKSPMVVRSVSVGPAPAVEPDATRPHKTAPIAPIVHPVLSRFMVVVEIMDAAARTPST